MDNEKCPICENTTNVSLNENSIPQQITCNSCEFTWDKKEEQEVKSGMYGEMPKLIIGKFEISLMSNKENEPKIWIHDSESGEGGEFEISSFESTVEKYFDTFF